MKSYDRLRPQRIRWRASRDVRRFLPLRLRVYGVGMAKTGTRSLRYMFLPRFRSGHEIAADTMLPVNTQYLRGEIDDETLQRALRKRSRSLRLEVDVANFLSPVAGPLASLYPDVLFILTIRDCFSWFSSYADHVLRDPPASWQWAEYRAASFGPEPGAHRPEEAALERQGLPSLETAFRRWARETATVIESVPARRLLVVKTRDLSSSQAEIGTFCGIDPTMVRAVHAGSAPRRRGVLAEVSTGHLIRVAEDTCEPLMRRFWGANWRDLVKRSRPNQ